MAQTLRPDPDLRAQAGLTPRQRESGTRQRKVGNARLRRRLFVPALAARRCNPALRDQAARLTARGKTGKVRVAAVRRKLLGLCVGVLRSGEPWNPTGRPTPKPQKSSL